MSPKEGNTNKNSKNKETLTKTPPAMERDKPKDPPGVHMPSEKEMSPPQFG